MLWQVVKLVVFGCVVGLVGVGIGKHHARAGEPAGEDFRPIREAKMPEGFPDYTPVGKIEVKHYPAYRKASASGSGQFWSLFRHIKSNNIAMTAPVEMQYGDPNLPLQKEGAMSFLYERPDQGEAGAQGEVQVVDVPACTVVSIGCRGLRTSATTEQARASLLRWIEEHADSYSVAGPARVMGYNSPFIPRNMQFFEVQIPIAKNSAS